MPRSDAEGILRRAGHALGAYWVVLALVIPLAIVAVAAAVLIWPIDSNEGAYATKAYLKYATPSSLAPLLNDQAAVGDSVFLNGVRLIPATKPDEFLVRGLHGNYLLVIANGGSVSLDKPAVANVQGVVRTLPPASTLKREWKLNKKELSLIAGEQYYVDAQRIHLDTPANSVD